MLFRLVADNASMARAMFVAAHLVNTFILVARLTLTAPGSRGPRTRLDRAEARRVPLAGGVGCCSLTGVSGAVAALGDTLYPSATFADALRADLSATSHSLIRLRLMHPAIAIGAALVVVAVAFRTKADAARAVGMPAVVVALVVLQLAAGLLNVVLLAPIWMQMVHLFVADLVWIAYVLMAARALAEDSHAARPHTAAVSRAAVGNT